MQTIETEFFLPPLPERVEAGMAFFDANLAPEWPWLIDCDKLDVAEFEDCPLGQLAGTYFTGMEKFALDDLEVIRLGFNGAPTDPTGTMEELTAAWQAAIRQRRRQIYQGAPSPN